MRIGYQVYHGLAGLLYVTDEEEELSVCKRAPGCASFVIQDARLTQQSARLQRGWDGDAMMMGFMGNRVLVNGGPDYELSLAPGPNRLRLLNGSNATYLHADLAERHALYRARTDGGLLRSPVTRDRLSGTGERLDLWWI